MMGSTFAALCANRDREDNLEVGISIGKEAELISRLLSCGEELA